MPTTGSPLNLRVSTIARCGSYLYGIIYFNFIIMRLDGIFVKFPQGECSQSVCNGITLFRPANPFSAP